MRLTIPALARRTPSLVRSSNLAVNGVTASDDGQPGVSDHLALAQTCRTSWSHVSSFLNELRLLDLLEECRMHEDDLWPFRPADGHMPLIT